MNVMPRHFIHLQVLILFSFSRFVAEMLGKEMWELRNDGTLTDVTFELPASMTDTSITTISAHKLVLCSTSAMLRTMIMNSKFLNPTRLNQTHADQNKPNHTKPNSITSNPTHPYQTKLIHTYQTHSYETKLNLTKPDSSTPNQTKPASYLCINPESWEEANTGLIKVDDTTAEGFLTFLECLYTRKLPEAGQSGIRVLPCTEIQRGLCQGVFQTEVEMVHLDPARQAEEHCPGNNLFRPDRL